MATTATSSRKRPWARGMRPVPDLAACSAGAARGVAGLGLRPDTWTEPVVHSHVSDKERIEDGWLEGASLAFSRIRGSLTHGAGSSDGAQLLT